MIGSNAAAMCKALESVHRDMWDLMGSSSETFREILAYRINTTIRAALAKPPRNCDIYGWRDAWEKWRTENHPKNPKTYNEAYESTAAFMDWFMGTADKGGAA